jgi:hypothetical protein
VAWKFNMSFTAIQMVTGTDAPNAAAAQYTQASNSVSIVRHAVFTNHTAGAVTITAHVVPSGGSASAANKVLDAYSIAAHTAYVSPELSGCVLTAGDTIQTVASAATSIGQNISGILQT